MKLIFPALIAVSLVSCRSQPPSVAILIEPKVEEIKTGSEIKLLAKVPLTKERVIYSWSTSGACQEGKFSGQSRKEVYFTPPI